MLKVQVDALLVVRQSTSAATGRLRGAASTPPGPRLRAIGFVCLTADGGPSLGDRAQLDDDPALLEAAMSKRTLSDAATCSQMTGERDGRRLEPPATERSSYSGAIVPMTGAQTIARP